LGAWPRGQLTGLDQSRSIQQNPQFPTTDGDSAPPKGHSRQFSAHVYCGQTAGWIKIPLGTEVGLGPGDIVLDGDPAAPAKKEGQPPIFSPCPCDQPARWTKMSLGREVGLGSGDIALDGTELPRKRDTAPNFRPMSVVAKRSPISATARLLFNFYHFLSCN